MDVTLVDFLEVSGHGPSLGVAVLAANSRTGCLYDTTIKPAMPGQF
jgi:hypothetical protein